MSYSDLLLDSEKRFNILRWINIKDHSSWLLVGKKSAKLVEYLDQRGEEGDFFPTYGEWHLSAKQHKYDYILLYDLELSEHLILEFREKLSAEGLLLILNDNIIGARDLGGYSDTDTGIFFDGIHNKKSGKVTLKRIKEILHNCCSDTKYKIYFPYPTNDFAEEIFSEHHLPQASDLHNSSYPIADKRLNAFGMQEFYERAEEAGILQEIMNSYLVTIGLDIPKCNFVKFSTERSKKYQIMTEIDGNKGVLKRPISEESRAHLNNLLVIEEELSKKFSGTVFKANKCGLKKNGIELEYVQGTALSDLLDDALNHNNIEKFWRLIDQYLNNIRVAYPGGKSTFLDIDLIFQNIIINDDIWNVIDYEWTPQESLPITFVIFRAVHYYFYQSSICREYFKIEELYNHCGIKLDEVASLEAMEKKFQMDIGVPIQQFSDAPDQVTVNQLLESRKQAGERLEAMNFWKDRADERMDLIKKLEKQISELNKLESDMKYIKEHRSWKLYKKWIHFDD